MSEKLTNKILKRYLEIEKKKKFNLYDDRQIKNIDSFNRITELNISGRCMIGFNKLVKLSICGNCFIRKSEIDKLNIYDIKSDCDYYH